VRGPWECENPRSPSNSNCPKALVRSDLWKAGRGDRPKGVPTLDDFAAARAPGTDSSAYDADYARRMPSELY
jgi:hypothetical protein